MLTWITLPFAQLTTTQLYEMMKLRVDVFVVEQTCPYPELDGKDTLEGVYHLIGYHGDELVACARLLPAGTTYDNVSIGILNGVTKQVSQCQFDRHFGQLSECRVKAPVNLNICAL